MSNRTWYEQCDWRRREYEAMSPRQRAEHARRIEAALRRDEPQANENDTQPLNVIDLRDAELWLPDETLRCD